MLRIGQKVACIDNTHTPELRRRQVYVIREIFEGDDGGIGVNVEGVDPGIWFAGFRAERFRPIPQTDISIFQVMLQPVRENV